MCDKTSLSKKKH